MAKAFVDYYKLLGIQKNATENEIRKAYRAASKKYHPDMNINSSDEARRASTLKFLLIQEAKETLLNKDARREYNIQYNEHKRKQSYPSAYVEDTAPIEEMEDFSRVWPKPKQPTPNQTQAKAPDKQKPTPNQTQAKAPNKQKPTPAPTKKQYSYSEFDEEKLHTTSARRGERKSTNGKKSQHKRNRLSVSERFLKELRKLAIRPNDTLKKYVLRNRGKIIFIVSTTIATSLLVGAAKNKSKEEQVVPETTLYTTQTEYTEVPETTEQAIEVTLPTFEEDIVLLRVHKVEVSDSLSKFSADSNTLMEEIKNYNGMNGNNVILGTKIRIPYIISPEDLPYYTKVEAYQGEDLDQYAESFETEAETICKLNPEAARWDGTKYVVATDSLIVPDFITKEECLVRKAADRNEQKTLTK